MVETGILYKHFANPVSRPQDAVRDRCSFVVSIFVDMKRSRSYAIIHLRSRQYSVPYAQLPVIQASQIAA